MFFFFQIFQYLRHVQHVQVHYMKEELSMKRSRLRTTMCLSRRLFFACSCFRSVSVWSRRGGDSRSKRNNWRSRESWRGREKKRGAKRSRGER